MHRERLAKLSWLLRNIRTELPQVVVFDLDHFHFNGTTYTDYGDGVLLADSVKECGTVACACGAAGQHTWFMEQGFYAVGRSVHYGFSRDFAAVCEFFGLMLRDAYWLFHPDYYEDGSLTTPDEVADRIDEFMGVRHAG